MVYVRRGFKEDEVWLTGAALKPLLESLPSLSPTGEKHKGKVAKPVRLRMRPAVMWCCSEVGGTPPYGLCILKMGGRDEDEEAEASVVLRAMSFWTIGREKRFASMRAE